MSISVIICAYTMDRWEDLSAAVESAFAQSVEPSEVIVVIDYNDELLDRSRREFVNATVVANVATKGLSGARNTGVATSSGEIIAFLDDDAFADSDWLEELTAPFSNPGVAGVGGWVIPHWVSRGPSWMPETFYWTLGCSYRGLPEDGSAIRNPIGANMAIRRRVFGEVGGFTDGLGRIGRNPLGCEETELSIRYQKRFPEEGFVICRSAIVHHRVPASRLTWSYFSRRCWGEGLSKAAVSSLVGTESGLASERRHVLTAVPLEVVAALRTLPRRPIDGLRRIAWILGGTAAAAAGLIRGRIGLLRAPLSSSAGSPIPGLTKLLSGEFTVSLLDKSTSRQGPQVSAPHSGPLAGIETSPVRLVQFDLDEPTDSAPSVYAGERIWVEVIRDERVVAVLDRSVYQSKTSTSFWSDLVEEFQEPEPDVSLDVPDNKLPKASVVVPTMFRRHESLMRTLDSLQALDYPEFELIVVDNRDPLLAGDAIEFPQDWNVKVIVESRPGNSAARNRGIAESRGEIVAFTDDDVQVGGNWLRALATRFVLDEEIDAVGGMVRPQALDTRAQLWFEEYYGGFTHYYRRQKWNRRIVVDDPLFPYTAGRFGASCNIAVRRSTLERLGGFNCSLGGGTPSRGGEDLELFVRLLDGGGTVAFEPSALVRHSHRDSDREFFQQVFDYGAGLTAMYTSLVLHRPGHFIQILKRLPLAVGYFRRPGGERSISRVPSYPKKTITLSILGMLYGPFAYLLSITLRGAKSQGR